MPQHGRSVSALSSAWAVSRRAAGELLRWISRRSAVRTLLENELPELESEIRLRQALHLAKQVPIHAAGNLGNGIATAWVFWDRVPHFAILSWLGLFTAFSAIQLQRWWQRRHRPPPSRVGRGALIRATAWSFVAGALWGLAASYAFPSDSLPHQLFLAFVVGGVAAGAVASMAAQPIACVAYLAPALLPVFALFARETGSISHAMAAMYACYFVGLLAVLLSGYTSFVDAVRTKVENRTLATGLAEASSASRAKTEFLAHMSHELRTPLTAILGFSEIIRDELLGPNATERYRAYANDIYESGRHLLLIINDILDTSRIEVGRLVLYEDPVDVAAIVAQSIALVDQRARAAGISLATQVSGDMPILVADALRMKQILLNLLANSIKFTRRGGGVTVGSAVRQDGSLVIWVTDTGIGMTKSEIAIALEPYRQVESVVTRRYEGTGLGLPLARALVEMQGGHLEIDSTPDVGTTISINFPAARVRRRGTAQPGDMPPLL